MSHMRKTVRNRELENDSRDLKKKKKEEEKTGQTEVGTLENRQTKDAAVRVLQRQFLAAVILQTACQLRGSFSCREAGRAKGSVGKKKRVLRLDISKSTRRLGVSAAANGSACAVLPRHTGSPIRCALDPTRQTQSWPVLS